MFFCPQICSSFWIPNLGLQSSGPNIQEGSLFPTTLPPISTKAKFSVEFSTEKKKNLRNRFLSLQFHHNFRDIWPYPSLLVLTSDPTPILLCTTFQPQNSSSKIHYSFHICDFDQTSLSCRNILSSLLSSILLTVYHLRTTPNTVLL